MATTSHVLMELIYSRFLYLKLPAVNVHTRDIKRQCARGLHVHANDRDMQSEPLAQLDAFPNLARLTVSTRYRIIQLDLENLGSTTTFTHLDLSSCHLVNSHVLSHMRSLVHLNVAGNRMRYLGQRNIACLTRLETLDISYSNCSSLDFLGGLTRLTALTMHGNKHPSMASVSIGVLATLPRLRSLDVRSWCFENAAALGALTGLVALNIGHARFAHGTTDPLGNLTNLQSLQMGYCHHPGEFLGYLTALTTLDLTGCTGGHLEHISRLTTLASLNLTSCHIGGQSMSGLSGLAASLTALFLWDNGSTGNVGADHVARLTSLRVLELRGCCIEDHSLLAPLCELTHLGIDRVHKKRWYRALFPNLTRLAYDIKSLL